MELITLTKEKAKNYKDSLYIKNKSKGLYLRLFNSKPEIATVPGIKDLPEHLWYSNINSQEDLKEHKKALLVLKRERRMLYQKYSNILKWRVDTAEDPETLKIVQTKNNYIDIKLSKADYEIYKTVNDFDISILDTIEI